jgi:hypothetical protein
MACYGDSFAFLYVDDVRTSLGTQTSTACYGVRLRLRLTVGQSVCLGVEPRLGPMTRCWLTDSYGPVLFMRPL